MVAIYLLANAILILNRSKRHYALKILDSDFYGEGGGNCSLFELEVMEKMAEVSSSSNHPGKDHVAHMVDHFDISGPTGTHICMVFRLLGASIVKQTTEAQTQQLPARTVKQITRQLLQALDFIHTECNIIHTDISPQNICLELADPQSVVAETHADREGNIELKTPSLLNANEVNVRLNDFGIACFFDRHLTDNISPPLLRAPEVTLGAPWDAKVDIFSLGALVLQFITGQLPFPGKGERNTRWCHESDRLAQLIGNFGGEPAVVLDNGDRTKEFLSNGVDLTGVKEGVDPALLEHYVVGNTMGKNGETDLLLQEVPVLCDLLRKMLATDPRRRESAGVLLIHPWLQ